VAAAEAAAKAFPAWSALGPTARRAKLNQGSRLLKRVRAVATLMMAKPAAPYGWGHFQRSLRCDDPARSGGDDHQITGEVVPSDVPGMMAMAIRSRGVCLELPRGMRRSFSAWFHPPCPLACGTPGCSSSDCVREPIV